MHEQIFDALEPLRDEFSLRRYRWALADAKREVMEDFRLLRLEKSRLSFSFVQFAEKLNREDRLTLLSACVKHANPRAVELTGDVITPLEESFYNQKSAHIQTGIALGLWPFDDQKSAKIVRKEFRKFLRANLSDRGLGEFDPWQLPAEWRYRLKVGNWTVETYIDTGGSYRQVGFIHAIRGPDDAPLFSHYLSDGLGAGSNEWNMLTDKDLPRVADDIVVLARHFIDSMPELLAGLEPPVVSNV
jgi:hypothetical protein